MQTKSITDTHGQLSVGIIGAGLTGLTTAFALKQAGIDCQVWEQSSRPGGVIRSLNENGYLIEEGPNSMLIKTPRVQQWLASLGIFSRQVAASEKAAKRFIVRNARAEAMPAGLLAAIRTPLYSTAAKLRILKEPFVRRSSDEDESVAEFVRRRLGPEFLDYGISCLVSGIYAGDPESLSIRHAFPKVWNLEQNHGSLIRGAIALGRKRKRQKQASFKSQMISFDSGLEVLPRYLETELGASVQTTVILENISREKSGEWTVKGRCAGEAFARRVDHLIITIPRHHWDQLPFSDCTGEGNASLRQDLNQVKELHYPPLSTLVLGFPREAVGHALDGFGMLIPAAEKRFILGTIFSSTLFPGRAPDGKVALMNFIGGALQPERAGLTESELVDHTCRDLRDLLKVRGKPSFVHHRYWPKAIPQYPVGHQHFLDQITNIERRFSGLHIQGNYRGGPGLSDCIDNSLDLAEQIRLQLRDNSPGSA